MIKITLDTEKFKTKPSGNTIGIINNRIAKNILDMTITDIAKEVGKNGRTWCPAVFKHGKRRISNFEQAQLLALDFDEGMTFEEVTAISQEYNLPIAFAYETFSSKNCDKFRIVFRLDRPITDKDTFRNAITVLMTIFDKCDKSCKDSARMFFGGKRLICCNKNNFITLESLEMNFNKYAYDKKGKSHADRFMRSFAKKENIDINRHNSIMLSGKNLTFTDSNININGEKLPHRKYRKNILDKLKNSCRLYSEFISDSEWLYYNELNGLAMNLIHVETGPAIFLKTIANSQYDTYNHAWDYYLKYFKKNQYNPRQCDSFCPYSGECPHDINMLKTAELKRKDIIRTKTPDYVSLEEAENAVNSAFNKAMNSQDKRIHVIKAQTAIGKTHLYLDYLKNTNTPCIVAVPTNILKNEIAEKCNTEGINAMSTPSVMDIKDDIPDKLYNKIQKLYDTGKGKNVTSLIRKYLVKHDNETLSDYLKQKEALKKFKGHIITTHSYMLYMKKSKLKEYNIIVDEDILKTIIKNQVTISIDKLKEALETNFPSEAGNKLMTVIEKAESTDYFECPSVKYKTDININFDLDELLNATHFYSDKEYIHFYSSLKLKKVKYVVLSATADEYIYKAFFGDKRVKFYNCPQAEYKGRLIQYYRKSYSRNYMKTNTSALEDTKAITGGLEPITFKGYGENDVIHFGNSEGCNFLAGKDLSIVGTPHQTDFIYKLLAFRLGGKIDDSLRYQEVSYNNFRFWFTTYKNELLRSIQFWLIESELEQTVGRARLLRKDCTVWLFSDFPLGQSELVGSDI